MVRSIKEKYGDDFYVRIGKKGGQNGVGHMFGHGKVDPHEAGLKGGKNKTLEVRAAAAQRMHDYWQKKREGFYET